MSNSTAARVAIATLLFLLFGTTRTARADWITWDYSWSNTPEVSADSPGTGQIILTSEASKSAFGDSNIVATNLSTYSAAGAAAPDTFTNKQYTLTLNITDANSGQSGTAVFTGVFNGTLSATSSNITNTFTSPTTVTLDLGGNAYTVTMNAYTPPGPSGSVNVGGIGALATVTVEQMPEPTSLMLAMLGFPLIWAGYRSKRRK